MAERRVVPLGELRFGIDAAANVPPPPDPMYSQQGYKLAKMMYMLRPHMQAAHNLLERQQMQMEHSISVRATVKNIVDDLIADVFKPAMGVVPETLQFYQNRYQYHHAIVDMKARLREILNSFNLMDDDAVLQRRLGRAATIITAFVDFLQAERLHAAPAAEYARQIDRLAREAGERGWDELAVSQELARVMPYYEYFEMAQEHREQIGERILWDLDFNTLQLNVNWGLPETMEAEEMSFEDTADAEELMNIDEELMNNHDNDMSE